MYQVAICEDETAVRTDLANRCAAILTDLNVRHDITVFASAEDLEAVLEVQAEPFDLLLLDIQLPGKTGVALGASLRGRDDQVGIIFITGSAAYALEGYKAQPCNYLLKPVSDEALTEALSLELKRHNRHQVVSFQYKGQNILLPAAEISYLESYDHGIRIHLTNDILFFFVSLSQVKEVLPPGMFARCHNSYLVNLSHIKSVSSARVVFRSGDELPVGRTYREEFQRAFINHFF